MSNPQPAGTGLSPAHNGSSIARLASLPPTDDHLLTLTEVVATVLEDWQPHSLTAPTSKAKSMFHLASIVAIRVRSELLKRLRGDWRSRSETENVRTYWRAVSQRPGSVNRPMTSMERRLG